MNKQQEEMVLEQSRELDFERREEWLREEAEAQQDEEFKEWLSYNKKDLIKEYLTENKINSEEFDETDYGFIDFCKETWRFEQ